MCENEAPCRLPPDPVDPRVQIELERLNSATDEINRLEVELDECRSVFRLLLCERANKTDLMRAKLGICIERAMPYYEARFKAQQALRLAQAAAKQHERADGSHSAAREMVYLAEQGLSGRTLDPAWQEMLNHATQRVNEVEQERSAAAQEHRLACVKYEALVGQCRMLQEQLQRAIVKSRPYFELKSQFNRMLESERNKALKYEKLVANSKWTYADALHNLEQISDEIHRSRNNHKIEAKMSDSNEWSEIDLGAAQSPEKCELSVPISEACRRHSLDNILRPTGERVKEIFTHGMSMLSRSLERRNSDPQMGDHFKESKLQSPLSNNLLTDDDINSLMLDKDLDQVCRQFLGTPISDVIISAFSTSTSH